LVSTAASRSSKSFAGQMGGQKCCPCKGWSALRLVDVIDVAVFECATGEGELFGFFVNV
jgi:hypothetical protein